MVTLPEPNAVLSGAGPYADYQLVVRQVGRFRYAGQPHDTAGIAGDVLYRTELLGIFATEVQLAAATPTAPAFAWLGVGLREGAAGLLLVSLLVRPDPEAIVLGLLDPERTPESWRARGRLLSREQALVHARKPEFFAVVDAVVATEPTLHDFCEQQAEALRTPAAAHPHGCACAECHVATRRLLDVGMTWPDCIAALPSEERLARTWRAPGQRPDFIVFDGSRHFVRSLFPVPLEDGAEFRYGVWLQVSERDFHRIASIWNDEPAYAQLRFQARLANALAPWDDRTLGCLVEAAPRRGDQRPYVVGAADTWLATALRDGWDQATYERIAQPYQR